MDPRNDSLWPRDWYVGLVAHDFGDAPALEILGAVDAGLGRKSEAIAEAKRACELLSLTKDAWDGPSLITNLAWSKTGGG